MPLFSIIVPFYNAQKTLAETLVSIKNQQNTQWELIAVNDGSTDNSLAIYEEITHDWSNVTLINQENKGLGVARNIAAKKASGTWLVFLDADDIWSNNKLDVLEGAIAHQHDVDFMYHAIFERYANGILRKRKLRPIQNTRGFIYTGNPFVPSAIAIKKNAFLKFHGFVEDRNQVEDLGFWFTLLDAKINMKAINKPLTIYRMGEGITANLNDHLQKVEVAAKEACQKKLISAAERDYFLTHKNYEAARQLHKLGDFKQAIEFYQKGHSTLKSKCLVALCKIKFRV